MRKRTLVATIIALSVMGLCACESNALLPEKQTETDETKIATTEIGGIEMIKLIMNRNLQQ